MANNANNAEKKAKKREHSEPLQPRFEEKPGRPQHEVQRIDLVCHRPSGPLRGAEGAPEVPKECRQGGADLGLAIANALQQSNSVFDRLASKLHSGSRRRCCYRGKELKNASKPFFITYCVKIVGALSTNMAVCCATYKILEDQMDRDHASNPRKQLSSG